ncbi:MAG: lipid-A-disaccharide synthase, partial [Bacteroidetes bacterium]
MKYYLISGEASGDLHGSNLIKSLRKYDENAHFRGVGGDLMQMQGLSLLKHYKSQAYMGFVEVVKHLPSIFKSFSEVKKDILAFGPDVLILIDYPGFNLRVAKWAKKQGIKVFYYISPQVWAWKSSRVYDIKRYVDKMFVILPFEKEFYAKYDYKVDYVGHPLIDAVENYLYKFDERDKFLKFNNLDLEEKPLIALLPGSREQEIEKILPKMISVASYYPGYQFVISGAPSIHPDFYTPYLRANVSVIFNQTYELLRFSEAALVTSGTATLETALFKVPQVVCYKANDISVFLAKKLINIKYISLVNLIMNTEVVKELIQKDLTKENLKKELDKILHNKP